MTNPQTQHQLPVFFHTHLLWIESILKLENDIFDEKMEEKVTSYKLEMLKLSQI